MSSMHSGSYRGGPDRASSSRALSVSGGRLGAVTAGSAAVGTPTAITGGNAAVACPPSLSSAGAAVVFRVIVKFVSEMEATPLVTLAVPSSDPPSKKPTLPETSCPLSPLTVAVSVTLSPTSDGLRLDESAVDVACWTT